MFTYLVDTTAVLIGDEMVFWCVTRTDSTDCMVWEHKCVAWYHSLCVRVVYDTILDMVLPYTNLLDRYYSSGCSISVLNFSHERWSTLAYHFGGISQIIRQYWKNNRLPDLLCKVWYKRYVDVDWLPARTEFNSNWSIGKVISGVIRMFRYR
jgi:hypothetical protein